MTKPKTRIPVAMEIDGEAKTVMVSPEFIDDTIKKMQQECLRRIDAELDHLDLMKTVLKERRKEVEENCDIGQISQLNYTLQHHEKK